MRAPLLQAAHCAEAPSPAEACASAAVAMPPRSPARKKRDGAGPFVFDASAPPAAARARAFACFVAVALLTCSYSLLLQLSKDAHGGYAYSPLAVTFVAESVKLAISAAAAYGASAPPPPLRLADCAASAVPALLYVVQNNLVFLAMRHMDPPLYQLLSNLKIVATALLTRIVLRRLLTQHQWAGVTLLALASALPGLAAFLAGDSSAAGALTHHDKLFGSAVMLIVATTSGLAGVLTEKLLKTAPGSMHFKNMQLYAAGVLIYLPAVWSSLAGKASFFELGGSGSGSGIAALALALFAGWTPLTLLLVLNLSVQGLAISWLLRWASNIEKLFAGVAALFLSMALSMPLFGYVPCAADVAGGALVCVALTVYHWREIRQ